MSESFNTAKQLKHLIEEGCISKEAMRKITGISENDLDLLLGEQVSNSTQFLDESARISMLTAQLTTGVGIQDDERLAGIIQGLVEEFQFSLDNIALLIGTSVEELRDFLHDPDATTADRKYVIAGRVSYLNLAIANARPQ